MTEKKTSLQEYIWGKRGHESAIREVVEFLSEPTKHIKKEEEEEDPISTLYDHAYNLSRTRTTNYKQTGYVAKCATFNLGSVHETEETCVREIIDCLINEIDDAVRNDDELRPKLKKLSREVHMLNEEQFMLEVKKWDSSVTTSWSIESVTYPWPEKSVRTGDQPTIDQQCQIVINVVKDQLARFPDRSTCIVYYGVIRQRLPTLGNINKKEICKQFSVIKPEWKITPTECFDTACFEVEVE